MANDGKSVTGAAIVDLAQDTLAAAFFDRSVAVVRAQLAERSSKEFSRITTSPRAFDTQAFFAAVDARRRDRQLSWPALATAIWDQSHVLNARRNDHPISPATIRKLADSRGPSCQHALFLLRWLEVPPETFIAAPRPGTANVPLPEADEAHRLRWDLRKLYGALNAARTARGATWQQTADRLRCTPHQLTALRTAKFATGMLLAMRISQALHRPAADFVHAAEW